MYGVGLLPGVNSNVGQPIAAGTALGQGKEVTARHTRIKYTTSNLDAEAVLVRHLDDNAREVGGVYSILQLPRDGCTCTTVKSPTTTGCSWRRAVLPFRYRSRMRATLVL